MNVLVVAPHPDDDAIGCGGTICLHSQRGDRVSVAFLTSGELGLKHLAREDAWRIRECEAERAAEAMQVSNLSFFRFPDWYLDQCTAEAADALHELIARERPSLIYLPHEDETHPDHRVSKTIVCQALPPGDQQSLTLLTYEVWTPLRDWYHVENISLVMRLKLAAVACHASQISQLPYQRAALGLNLYRGATAGACKYAEIFQTISRES